MIETIVTIAIVLAAAFWFFRWIRGAASGEKGCGCGGCGKKCASANAAAGDAEDGCGCGCDHA